jgi:hypothetical protein
MPVVESGGVCFWRESEGRRSVLCRCFWQEDTADSRLVDYFTFNLVLKSFINSVLSIKFTQIGLML